MRWSLIALGDKSMPVYPRECYSCDIVAEAEKFRKILAIFSKLNIEFDGTFLWHVDSSGDIWTLEDVLKEFDSLETEESE